MAAQSTTGSFTGTIPENYDTHLGPILFEFTGADMAKRVSTALNGTGRVLEVAFNGGPEAARTFDDLAVRLAPVRDDTPAGMGGTA